MLGDGSIIRLSLSVRMKGVGRRFSAVAYIPPALPQAQSQSQSQSNTHVKWICGHGKGGDKRQKPSRAGL
jgi:hypothetical protein